MNLNAGDCNSTISAVSVKPPPFWWNSPELWFNRLEAQFEIAGIVSQRTKFNYVLSVLDGDIIRIVSDIIREPNANEPYDTLKSSLIQRLSASEVTKLNQLLSDLNLGDRQPSQLLREMKELGGDKVSEDLLRSLWLQRLPDNIQAILACNPGSLNDLAKCADKINEIYNKPKIFSVAIENKSSPEFDIQKQIEILTKQVKELSLKINDQRYLRFGRSRSRSRKSSQHDASKNKFDLCWYHYKFSDKAVKCIQPCAFVTKSKN